MIFKEMILYRKGLLIYGLVLVLINIFLTQLPLTSTFGYEFAAVNGLLLAIIAGLQTFNFINKSEFVIAELIKNLLILFILPFCISMINSMLTMFCSFSDGLAFYLLITTASVFYGTAAAFVIILGLKKFYRIFFFIVIILTAIIPVAEIYYYPQVYFYSPLIGFFPGNIYDEGLSPDWKLFFHQIFVIIISVSIIYFIIKQSKFVLRYKTLFIISILIIVFVFQYIASSLGYTTTFTKLDSILTKKIDTGSSLLHYDNIDSTEAKLIALSTEFYYSELYSQLKIKPSKKINVYLFNNRNQKKKIFGAGNADVAKPWQYSVYISADSWQRTLKHELAHVFTAEFGSGIFKLASGFNAALIEGMAESLDGISNDISIKDLTALAYNNGYVINVESLFKGLSFFKGNSSLAYTYSGTFIQYLTSIYGIEKVKEYYSNGDFESVFNKNISIVRKEFETSISNIELSNQKSMADYYYGRLSIIQKVCPRFVGDRLNEAYEKLSKKDFVEARKLFEEINNKTLNYSSLFGLSEIFNQQNKIDKAIRLVKHDYEKFNGTAYYHNMIFRLGELYALNYQFDSAALCYNKIITDYPNHNLFYLSKTRLSLLATDKLSQYLTGDDSLKLTLLISLNENEYNYNSLPIILDLLKINNIDYKKSLTIFNQNFIVNNIESSFAALKLSEYMLENFDIVNARKYAALGLRFRENNIFFKSIAQQFEKTNWLIKNSEKVLGKFRMFRIDQINNI